jgi:splicing factor 3B subunit 3
MTNQNDNNNNISSDLKLLDLTLKNAGAIQFSCMGDFTAPSSQEIILSRPGGAIEIYRIETSSSNSDGDKDNDDSEEEEPRFWLKLILRTETMSTLRSMETVRLSGEKRDLVLIGSDSGCVSVLDFNGGEKANVLHCPVLGKTGKFEHVENIESIEM